MVLVCGLWAGPLVATVDNNGGQAGWWWWQCVWQWFSWPETWPQSWAGDWDYHRISGCEHLTISSVIWTRQGNVSSCFVCRLSVKRIVKNMKMLVAMLCHKCTSNHELWKILCKVINITNQIKLILEFPNLIFCFILLSFLQFITLHCSFLSVKMFV